MPPIPWQRFRVSIHAPREGSDVERLLLAGQNLVFQSTPPERGATSFTWCIQKYTCCFNPRPPRGERHNRNNRNNRNGRFQSTPPERGATRRGRNRLIDDDVSIHAPREGSDIRKFNLLKLFFRFNPRPPRGERRPQGLNYIPPPPFQSTPPERGATITIINPAEMDGVSIHAPREGSDDRPDRRVNITHCFNPRPPRGERLRPR